MSQSLDRLIYMANQIARNLGRQPDAETAVADHLAKFWDPRMRTMIVSHVRAEGAGLDALATRAVRRLASKGAPPPQSQATVFSDVDEPGGSDAG